MKLPKALDPFKKKPPKEESTTDSSSDKGSLNLVKTPSPDQSVGEMHSPHRGGRLKFLSKFGKALGGSSAEDSDKEETARRLQAVKRTGSKGWEDQGKVPTHSVWKVFDKQVRETDLNPLCTR